MKLDVYVSGTLAGVLESVDVHRFVFTYDAAADPLLPLSLLMPVRTESYVSREIHPVFQVSMPEGALRAALTKRLAKQLGRVTEMHLLESTGHKTIGRVQLMPHGQPLRDPEPDPDIDYLLQQSNTFLEQWFLEERIMDAGVSGGYPKGLSTSPIGDQDAVKRETLRNEHWIIKLDDAQHPALSFNEFWSMEVARAAGLPTPETRLAKDMRSLGVKRFDRQEDGTMLAFEDFCALMGKPAQDKFSGSVERLVKHLRQFVDPKDVRSQLRQFFMQYVLVNTLRNADAHLKNFGLLYDDAAHPKLSPVFDMVTMALYSPPTANGDAQDTLALNFGGTKRWLTRAQIDLLAKECGITEREREHILSHLSRALEKTAESMVSSVPEDRDLCNATRRMLALWSHGATAAGMPCKDRLGELANMVVCELDRRHAAPNDDSFSEPGADDTANPGLAH